VTKHEEIRALTRRGEEAMAEVRPRAARRAVAIAAGGALSWRQSQGDNAKALKYFDKALRLFDQETTWSSEKVRLSLSDWSNACYLDETE
jgi:hypothetical protein